MEGLRLAKSITGPSPNRAFYLLKRSLKGETTERGCSKGLEQHFKWRMQQPGEVASFLFCFCFSKWKCQLQPNQNRSTTPIWVTDWNPNWLSSEEHLFPCLCRGFQNGVDLKPGKNCRIYSMGRKRFCQILQCSLADSGTYTCDAGEAETSCSLVVYGKLFAALVVCLCLLLFLMMTCLGRA